MDVDQNRILLRIAEQMLRAAEQLEKIAVYLYSLVPDSERKVVDGVAEAVEERYKELRKEL